MESGVVTDLEEVFKTLPLMTSQSAGSYEILTALHQSLSVESINLFMFQLN